MTKLIVVLCNFANAPKMDRGIINYCGVKEINAPQDRDQCPSVINTISFEFRKELGITVRDCLRENSLPKRDSAV
jgi:hypothetical protein